MASTSQDEFTLDIPCEEVESIGSTIKVPCHLSPEISAVDMEIRWFKETDCVCLYKNGQMIEGRGYEGRVSLFSEMLERGDVSLQLRDCRESDTGFYLCQVTSGDRTEELAVIAEMFGNEYGLLHKLVKVEKEWTQDERKKMKDSVLLTAFKKSEMFELLRRSIEEKNREMENMQQQLMEIKMALDCYCKEVENLQLKLQQTEVMSVEKDKKISDLQAQIKQIERIQTTDSDQITHCADSSTDMSGETPDSGTPIRKRNSTEGRRPNLAEESSTADSQVPVPVPELRLVLLGRSGSGKSAAANTILGREERSQAGTSTVTQQSESRQGEVAGRKVTVVDTPDWFCPKLSLEEVRQDVGLCVRLSAPGPHVFLLVIPITQPAGEERGMMEKMEEIFWESCWRNTIIVFTVTDDILENITKEFIQSGNQEVQKLVEKCGNRFHCLNIKNYGDGSQVSELLEKIEEMVLRNEEKFYSSEIYHEIRKMEERIIREREENKDREMSHKITQFMETVEKEVQNALRGLSEQIQELERRLQEHQEQITKLEGLIKEERYKEKISELEVKLHREIQKKEETEQQLNELIEERDKERYEVEEKHRQEMEQIRELYEGEATMEAERKLMKIVLPELHRTVWVIMSMVQKQFLEKLERKDRELLTMKQKLSEITENYRQLEQDYQSALRRTADIEAGEGETERENTGTFGEGEEGEQMETISIDGDQIDYEERGQVEREECEAEETQQEGQEQARGFMGQICQVFFYCCLHPQEESEECVSMRGGES